MWHPMKESGPEVSGTEAVDGGTSRGQASTELFAHLWDQYRLGGGNARDLGGSYNLNLLITGDGRRSVVRVYRLWVTPARLTAMQQVRQHLAAGGVPCVQPLHTLDGQTWMIVNHRLVEVEPYIEHDANMDSWERLEAGLPLLGRIHSLLRPLEVSEEGAHAPMANYIEPATVLAGTLRGTQRIRVWHATPVELQIAAAAEELAYALHRMQGDMGSLPRQLVHGDYWDNNVLFRSGHIVQIADLDFMGVRARIDDLALTLYYTNSTLPGDPASDDGIRRLRLLVDAYNSGLDQPLTSGERAALPLAIARAPLCFIAEIAWPDYDLGARPWLATHMPQALSWTRGIVRRLGRWQAAFA